MSISAFAQVGTANHGQFSIYNNNDGFKLVVESYRPITKSGHSDRRYNYTTSSINFKDPILLKNNLINSLNSDKTIIKLKRGRY